MNPDVDFHCKNGKIIMLKHRTYPWSDNGGNSTIHFGEDIIARSAFYTYIQEQVVQVIPYLFNDYGYSLKQLVLPWIWGKFSRGNCVMAGICFQHMVHERRLPFSPRDMPSDSSGTRHYFYTGPESFTYDSVTRQLIPIHGGIDASTTFE